MREKRIGFRFVIILSPPINWHTQQPDSILLSTNDLWI